MSETSGAKVEVFSSGGVVSSDEVEVSSEVVTSEEFGLSVDSFDVVASDEVATSEELEDPLEDIWEEGLLEGLIKFEEFGVWPGVLL